MEDGTYRVIESGDVELVSLTTGYMVAIKPAESGMVYPTGTLLGSWTDTETGVVYWDEVEVIDNLLTAGNVARQRGEIAIWDCFNNCEFRV